MNPTAPTSVIEARTTALHAALGTAPAAPAAPVQTTGPVVPPTVPPADQIPEIAPPIPDPNAPVETKPETTETKPTDAKPVETKPADAIPDVLDLPVPATEISVDELLSVDPAAPATTPAPEADTEETTPIDVDLNAIERDKKYMVEGRRFTTIYKGYKAAQELTNEYGINPTTPEGIAAVKNLIETQKGFQQFLSDIRSPEDVKHFGNAVISWDREGGIARNVINSILEAAPEVKAQFEQELGGTSFIQELGELYQSATGDDDNSRYLRNSVKWIAQQRGIDLKAIEAVKPRPKLTPEQIENIRLKRELAARDSTSLQAQAQQIHNTIGTEVSGLTNSAIDGYVKALVPKLFENNLPAHLTDLKKSVTMKLRSEVSVAFKSDPEFSSAVRAAQTEVNAGRITDPAKIVQIYRAKLDKMLSPSNRNSTFYTTLSNEVQNAKAKLAGKITTRAATATAAAAAPATTQSGTPAIKAADPTVRQGETKQEARQRFLRESVGIIR